jgi:thymidylate synthase ThyX
MDIRLLKSTGELTTQAEFLKFAQDCARVCYSDKDWEALQEEAFNSGLIDKRILPSGHHSVFEHMNLTFYFDGMPKALVMAFNNEKQYATSEKSARYTQMDAIEPTQQQLYDKWMGIFGPKIEQAAPESQFPKLYQAGSDGKTTAQKLAQENARYMTSVFTPTQMVHTLNLRQLNFLMNQFDRFGRENEDNTFNQRLADSMTEFNNQAYPLFGVPKLENQTDRHLSLFGKGLEALTGTKVVDEHFAAQHTQQCTT